MKIRSKILGRVSVAASLCAAGLMLAISATPVRSADPGPSDKSTIGGNGPIADEMNQETRDAIKRGLEWLKKNITKEGGINSGGGDNVAIVSLAGIAFLAGGSMPNDGPYGVEVAQTLDYVLKNCQDTGLIATPNYGSPMYGHGFATLFLAEAYGMSQRPDLKEKLQNAIRLIVRTQQPNVGGWRYQPLPNDSDLSVTICQIMALRAARNAGIEVPNKTIEDAIGYVKRSQNADGGFSYTLGGGGSAYPRSAAGVACLYYMRTGNAFEDEIKRGVAYVNAQMATGTAANNNGHFYYGNYYATQAMFMFGGDAWKAYWPSIRKTLLERQSKTAGNWSGESGDVYATSMALIMLQVPNRLLPILQK